MRKQPNLKRRVAQALVLTCLGLLPIGAHAQYQGGLDGAAVVGERGSYGGSLAADLQVPFCDLPTECGFAVGGSFQVGLATADQAADSRAWAALGPTLSFRGFSSPVWELALDVGGWVGGRDESLDGGYHLGVRGFFGVPLGDAAAIGLRAGVSFYGGARNWVTFQPGLALRWRFSEGS